MNIKIDSHNVGIRLLSNGPLGLERASLQWEAKVKVGAFIQYVGR